MIMGQNATAMDWLQLQWVEVSRCDKLPIFHPLLGWMNNLSTLGLNAVEVKHYKDEMSQ